MEVVTQLSEVTERYDNGARPVPGRASLTVAPRDGRTRHAARATPAAARDGLRKPRSKAGATR